MIQYINRNSKKISHIFFYAAHYKDESFDMAVPKCDGNLGIWLNRYGGATITAVPQFAVCKRCQIMRAVTPDEEARP